MEAKIAEFVKSRPSEQKISASRSSEVFKSVVEAGTELWLDTGDIEAATGVWDSQFTCLTTNNTLLNQVIQTGVYDKLVGEVSKILPTSMSEQERVVEIAFLLNAVHGMRLAQIFGHRVSVELHTDLSHDWKRSVEVGKRFAEIGGHHFIVKVPMTPDGLIAAKKLGEAGIDVNFTLGFSARQNYVAARFAKPAYVNVFLGRLNQYFQSAKLGSGDNVGEKTTLASQHYVRECATGTKQIAASMRSGAQTKTLAGVDVFTMPVAVAKDAVAATDGDQTRSGLEKIHAMTIGVDANAEKSLHLDKLWNVDASVVKFADRLCAENPEDPETIVRFAHEAGCGDIFPRLSRDDLNTLSADGKIPVHAKWADRVRAGEVALDSLLQVAALLSFTQDQQALDDRIRKFL
jgi:transaldolase